MFWRLTQLLILPIAAWATFKALGDPVWMFLLILAFLPGFIFQGIHWIFKGSPNGWQRNGFLVFIFYWLPMGALLAMLWAT